MADTDNIGDVDFSYFDEASTYENTQATYVNAGYVNGLNGFHGDKTESNSTSPKSVRSNSSSSKNIDNGPSEAAITNPPAMKEKPSDVSDSESDSVQLKGGDQLLEESKTETARQVLHTASNTQNTQNRQVYSMAQHVISQSNGTGTAKALAAKSPYSSPSLDSIPVEEINIPNDANISSFTSDQLANFLRCFNVENRIIAHLHRKKVDGKRFSRLRDSELESLGMNNNPVLVFFRDRSNVKASKKKQQFFVL